MCCFLLENARSLAQETRQLRASFECFVLHAPLTIVKMTREIPRIHDQSTPWLKLLVEFGFQNEPFILGSESTSSWLARKEWVLPDGRLNNEYLKKSYGNAIVPTLVNGTSYELTTLTEFLENMGDPNVYLKDWHFQNEFGTSMYTPNPFFSRDFVNCETWTSNNDENPFGDDYRFVYIGAAGSWTKFHADVVCSYSWSANICGRKKWFMMSPGSEEVFKSSSTDSGYVEDIREYQELFEQANVITFIQEPGEIVFVPSNWYHQVHNLEDTISINHNWMNSTNLGLVRDFLSKREEDVRNELSDCVDSFTEEEFEEKVEDILYADARLNKSKFLKLCELVRESRSTRKDDYDCRNHGLEVWKCISSPDCYSSITSICSCSISFCAKCSNFVKQLEYSIVSRFLDVHREPVINATIIRYGELFKACHSSNSIDYLQKAEDLTEEEKVELKKTVTQKLANASRSEDDIPWNVNIVIGNSHVAKSLRPIINIKMPSGENFEFDIDSFAQFRQQLAQIVLVVNPQE
ncbi:hypothetical protein L3Y34_000845 [Caenorhabditis briggsae]|uniref:Jumonji domain-containing protein 4 n=1 Tax=Caenorhabditis briggsae TaxID=6238 RepID=A0AAE9IPI1_CAEBR|nr:hypothetical protein L3Y34_000845 [Caenorhabditis briggsae]